MADIEDQEVLDTDQGVSEEAEVVEFDDAVESSEPAPDQKQETPEEEVDWDNIDPNKLPPEQLKFYKGMQGSYTRKMQGLSQALEGLKTHSTRLQLLDKAIAGDPDAQAQLARFVQQPRRNEPESDIPAEFTDTKHLVSYFDTRVQKAVEAALQQVGQSFAPIQQQMVQQKQMAEYEATKARFPDFDQHIPHMIEIRQQMPGISLEAAYKLATYKNPTPPTKLVSKPGARPAAVRPKNEGAMSFDEAAAAALKQLKGR